MIRKFISPKISPKIGFSVLESRRFGLGLGFGTGLDISVLVEGLSALGKGTGFVVIPFEADS